jgi:hypothetical protein
MARPAVVESPNRRKPRDAGPYALFYWDGDIMAVDDHSVVEDTARAPSTPSKPQLDANRGKCRGDHLRVTSVAVLVIASGRPLLQRAGPFRSLPVG